MKLTNNEIGAAVEEIRAFFEKSNVPRKDVIKICLVIEESLLRYQKKLGAAHDFQLYTRKFFSAPKIIIRVKGEAFCSLENEIEDDTALSNEVIQRLLNYEEAKTIYRYENSCNELISFSTRERRLPKIPGGSITVSIILAIIFSLIAGNFPPDVQKVLAEQIISPALSISVKLIVTVTVFMIFFSIVAGICAIEDVTMLNNIGATVLGRFFLLDAVIVAITFAIGAIFFPVALLTDKHAVDLSEISTMTDFLKVWEIIAAELIVYAIVIAFMLLRLVFKTKTSPADFLKKIFPAAIISLTTGSSVASLPKSLEISKESLHIEEKFCNFWIPLSLVLFSPSKLIQLAMAGFYVMAVTGETLSVAHKMKFLEV